MMGMKSATAKPGSWIENARAQYRTNRAACSRLTPARFDELAQGIARDLADGEDATPVHFLQAASILLSGQDYA